jgi:hypothetical protein
MDGKDYNKNNSQRFDEFMDIVKQLSQQEISDEEIEKASWKYEVRDKFDAYFIREAFIKGCKWYREQLKQNL